MRKNNKGTLQKVLSFPAFGTTMTLILFIVIALIFAPALFSLGKIVNLLKSNLVYAFVAYGVFFVLLSGGVDLSTGAIMSLACNVTAYIQLHNQEVHAPFWLMILVSVAIGCVCGMLNGFLVGVIKIQPMLATLGTQYIFFCVSYKINSSMIFGNMIYKEAPQLLSHLALGVPRFIWLLLVFAALIWAFLRYTKAGRKIYAVGSNAGSAKLAGINVSTTKVYAYMICGMMCGLAGFLYVCNFNVGDFNVASDYAMRAMSIGVLAGASPSGGKGNAVGLVVSVVLISFISYFTNLLPSINLWSDAIYSFLVLVALFLCYLTDRAHERRDLKEKEGIING